MFRVIYTSCQTWNCEVNGVKISSSMLNIDKLFVENVVFDAERWEIQLKSLHPLEQDTIEVHEQVFQAYTGDFLGDNDYFWLEKERERISNLWLNHAQQLSGYYLKNENYPAAVKIQERVQSIFPSKKDSYFFLMKLYDLLDYNIAVENQFRLLKKILLENMTMELCVDIERWYQNWKKRSGISRNRAVSRGDK